MNQDKKIGQAAVFIALENNCWYNCLFCTSKKKNFSPINDDRSFASILERINPKGKYQEGILLGGNEFFASRYCIELIEIIAGRGYKRIHIETSGLNLHDTKIIKRLRPFSRLLSFHIPVYGQNSLVHDAVAGRPGSFGLLGRSLRALKKDSFAVNIHSVIIQQNFRYLTDIFRWYQKKFPDFVFEGFLPWVAAPDVARRKYVSLMPRFTDILTMNKDAEVRKSLIAFPLCLLDDKKGKGADLPVFVQGGNSEAGNIYSCSKKPRRCQRCSKFSDCVSIDLQKYAQAYSDEEFKPC